MMYSFQNKSNMINIFFHCLMNYFDQFKINEHTNKKYLMYICTYWPSECIFSNNKGLGLKSFKIFIYV